MFKMAKIKEAGSITASFDILETKIINLYSGVQNAKGGESNRVHSVIFYGVPNTPGGEQQWP